MDSGEDCRLQVFEVTKYDFGFIIFARIEYRDY